MRSFPLAFLAGSLLLGCAHRPVWQVKGADLRATAGRDMLRACEDGGAEDCFALATRVEEQGAGSPAQLEALYHLHLQACEQGHHGACARLGYGWVYGDGPNIDPPRGQAALEAACDGGHGGSCHVAGASLDEGLLGETNERRAYTLFLQGCELDEPRCCAWVGLKLEFGRGTKQDRGKAFDFFSKACDLGEDQIGCFNTAMHLLERPEPDTVNALALMMVACDAGNAVACENEKIIEATLEEAEAAEQAASEGAPAEDGTP
jgi:TPR repeat protein